MITSGDYFTLGVWVAFCLLTYFAVLVSYVFEIRNNRRMKYFIKEHDLLNDYEKYVDEIKQDKKDAWRTAFSDK